MRCLESRQNHNSIPELLSPAGSFDTAVAVINAGADAVYLGGELFSARAYAENLSTERLLRLLDYAHLKDRRVYITINTLLKNSELEETLYDYFLPLYEGGVDGVIVQDMGVVAFLTGEFPKVPIHISTQAGVSTLEGVQFFEHRGIKRIVLSRELSLDEITYIHDNSNTELEVFGHGALCYSYSGRCLLSGMIGGRSANRGKCAGACRLPFSITGDEKNAGERYPLSLKDLSTINLIPRIAKAGVASLKIEGRMKQTRYAAGVTAIYRKYLDLYGCEGEKNYRVSDEDAKYLAELGNRSGFTDGYLTGRRYDMISMSSGSHTRAAAGEHGAEEAVNGAADISEIKEPVSAKLILKKDYPAQLTLETNGISVKVQGAAPQAAKSVPLEASDVKKKISATGDSLFNFSELETEMDSDVFMPVSALKSIRRDALEKLKSEMLKGFKREHIETKREERDKKPATDTAKDCKISVSVLTGEQLDRVLDFSPERVIADWFLYENILCETKESDTLKALNEYMIADGKSFAVRLPGIFDRDMAARISGFLKNTDDEVLFVCDSFDALGVLEKNGIDPGRVIAGDGLYSFSDRAGEYFLGQGIREICAPYEISKKELRHRQNSDTTLPVYGAVPVMYSAQCVLKNTGKCLKSKGAEAPKNRLYQGCLIADYLRDRKGRSLAFICGCESGCTNIYYNPDKLFLLHCMDEIIPLGVKYIRIDFTDETPEKCTGILNAAVAALRGERITPEDYEEYFTKGHFKRGV